MGKKLIIAEKPSVARDIARVLGAVNRRDGYIEGDHYLITWALGHLVSLCEPQEVDERYKRWSFQTLPMLPEKIPLKVLERSASQYRVVEKLMLDDTVDSLICATDAGREGERIFRLLVEYSGCQKPFDRLWISSMTDQAIKEGFEKLRPGAEYDTLGESARCRAEADWLVGMNASRAFTLRYGARLSIGRVQTPALAIVVARHLAIEAFVPEVYWEVNADFGDYAGIYTREQSTRIESAEKAKEIVSAVKGKAGEVTAVEQEKKSLPPPYLYDLTSLQRDANRKFSFSAAKTLEVAQRLYEQYKLITYPRTDSRFLPPDMLDKVRQAFAAVPFQALTKPLLQAQLKEPKRVFDASKVTDHHAIVPTATKTALDRLDPDAKKLYELVCRATIAAFYPDYEYTSTKVVTTVSGHEFVTRGTQVIVLGWREVMREEEEGEKDAAKTLPLLQKGDARTAAKVSSRKKETKPPKPHTDASLLDLMEHAGREVEDEALREQLKGSGLGTPATRAAIIERLIDVEYLERKGKALAPTQKGVRLIAAAPSELTSAETTAKWERGLEKIRQGEMDPGRFMQSIARFSGFLVDFARRAPNVGIEREPPRQKSVKTAADTKAK